MQRMAKPPLSSLLHEGIIRLLRLEAIAYRKGWISEERMRELAQPMIKNQYGQYLLKVIDELKREVNSTNILGKTGK